MTYLLITDAPPPDLEPGAKVAKLPEGTYLLDIQAYWTVDVDRKFRGGAQGYKISLENT